MLRALVRLALSFRVRTNLTATSRSQQRALLGFGPLQRLQPRKPGQLGFASPDTFRLQGFSPSCRLTSSAAFRPFFMPVTLLGFSFRAFSPRRSLRLLSNAVTFMTLTRGPMNSKKFSVHSTASPDFKALLSARIRHPALWGEPFATDRCPPGFRTSRVFFLPTA